MFIITHCHVSFKIIFRKVLLYYLYQWTSISNSRTKIRDSAIIYVSSEVTSIISGVICYHNSIIYTNKVNLLPSLCGRNFHIVMVMIMIVRLITYNTEKFSFGVKANHFFFQLMCKNTQKLLLVLSIFNTIWTQFMQKKK